MLAKFIMAPPSVAADEDPYIDVTAPSPIVFSTFATGINTAQSDTPGSVTGNVTHWHVTAKDQNTGVDKGKMLKGSTTPLTSPLQISMDGNTYADADVGVNYTGDPLSLAFYAKQVIAPQDTEGHYTITIIFTGVIDTP